MEALIAVAGLIGANILAHGILRRGWLPWSYRPRTPAELDSMKTLAQEMAGLVFVIDAVLVIVTLLGLAGVLD